MSRQRRVLIAARDYPAYLRSLAPALWFRMNEASGSVAANWGSLGASYNGAYTGCTLAQAGKLPGADAVLYDGANSKLDVPAGAYADYPAFTYAMLCKAASAGEGNNGVMYSYGNASSHRTRLNGGLASLATARGADVTVATATTTSGIPAAAWTWLFAAFDNGGDRRMHVLIGLNGVVTEPSYSPNTPASGPLTSFAATALTIGNYPNQSFTWNGLIDEFLLFNKVLTPAQMAQIVRVTGV